MLASIGEKIITIFDGYPFLEINFLGNKVSDYIAFILLFFLIFVAFKIFRGIVLVKITKIIKKIGNQFGELLISAVESIKNPFYWFLSFYLSANSLSLNPSFSEVLDVILISWLAYQSVKTIHVFIDYGINILIQKEGNRETQNSILTIGKIAKWSLWFIIGLLLLSNLGVEVTALIAGLGIGGIAIAFALQNILGDLFSSFAIYFDKPFIPGDFIIVGEHMGTVEKIGIKSTRLKALQGEEIVISNKELTSIRIQNFKKMQKRRIVFGFGVTYDTPLEKMKKINSIVSDIVKKEELSEFDRVHFAKFNDSSLDFEVVYYILSGNYVDYMNTHQNILFKIKKKFEEEKISMAFPTQTIHIEK